MALPVAERREAQALPQAQQPTLWQATRLRVETATTPIFHTIRERVFAPAARITAPVIDVLRLILSRQVTFGTKAFLTAIAAVAAGIYIASTGSALVGAGIACAGFAVAFVEVMGVIQQVRPLANLLGDDQRRDILELTLIITQHVRNMPDVRTINGFIPDDIIPDIANAIEQVPADEREGVVNNLLNVIRLVDLMGRFPGISLPGYIRAIRAIADAEQRPVTRDDLSRY